MTHKFFRIVPDKYDSIRIGLDVAAGLGPEETVYNRAQNGIKDSSGNFVLAIRVEHCEMPLYKSAIENAISNGWAEEISKQDYFACIPKKTIQQLKSTRT